MLRSLQRVHIVTRARAKAGERERERARATSQRASAMEGREERGVLAWMTRHCRGARVPRTLGHEWPRVCASSPVYVHAWCAPVTGSDPTRPLSDPLYTTVRTPTGCVYMSATNTLTRSRRSLWQSSPTPPPPPLNYSRHAVESFTQSFSYINATQRDCLPHGQFSRASPAVSSVARRGGRVKGVEARAFQSVEKRVGGTEMGG